MLTIRNADSEDVPAIFAMLRASAEEQRSLDHLCADEASLREDGFGPEPRFQVAIAEVDGKPALLRLFNLDEPQRRVPGRPVRLAAIPA